ncbi:unnamed protein product, partial [Callosobruchus maculatus]
MFECGFGKAFNTKTKMQLQAEHAIAKAQLAQKESKIEELSRRLADLERNLSRDERIQELRCAVEQRDREILNLRSQLDKFQSVFSLTNPASPKALSPGGGAVPVLGMGGGLRPRKQRAGISAEPQNEETILRQSKHKFPTIYKNER